MFGRRAAPPVDSASHGTVSVTDPAPVTDVPTAEKSFVVWYLARIQAFCVAELQKNLAFHLSGHVLHSLFWKNMDSVVKKPAPRTTAHAAPIRFSGFQMRWMPRIRQRTITTIACPNTRTEAENALAVTNAPRGVGVVSTLARTPASRSQITWMP